MPGPVKSDNASTRIKSSNSVEPQHANPFAELIGGAAGETVEGANVHQQRAVSLKNRQTRTEQAKSTSTSHAQPGLIERWTGMRNITGLATATLLNPSAVLALPLVKDYESKRTVDEKAGFGATARDMAHVYIERPVSRSYAAAKANPRLFASSALQSGLEGAAFMGKIANYGTFGGQMTAAISLAANRSLKHPTDASTAFVLKHAWQVTSGTPYAVYTNPQEALRQVPTLKASAPDAINTGFAIGTIVQMLIPAGSSAKILKATGGKVLNLVERTAPKLAEAAETIGPRIAQEANVVLPILARGHQVAQRVADMARFVANEIRQTPKDVAGGLKILGNKIVRQADNYLVPKPTQWAYQADGVAVSPEGAAQAGLREARAAENAVEKAAQPLRMQNIGDEISGEAQRTASRAASRAQGEARLAELKKKNVEEMGIDYEKIIASDTIPPALSQTEYNQTLRLLEDLNQLVAGRNNFNALEIKHKILPKLQEIGPRLRSFLSDSKRGVFSDQDALRETVMSPYDMTLRSHGHSMALDIKIRIAQIEKNVDNFPTAIDGLDWDIKNILEQASKKAPIVETVPTKAKVLIFRGRD